MQDAEAVPGLEAAGCTVLALAVVDFAAGRKGIESGSTDWEMVSEDRPERHRYAAAPSAEPAVRNQCVGASFAEPAVRRQYAEASFAEPAVRDQYVEAASDETVAMRQYAEALWA